MHVRSVKCDGLSDSSHSGDVSTDVPVVCRDEKLRILHLLES